MMMNLALAAAVATIATAVPALAGQDRYQPTAQDFRDGVCTRQQVHTPAGKMVHNAPIVRCDGAVPASRDAEAPSLDGGARASRAVETQTAR